MRGFCQDSDLRNSPLLIAKPLALNVINDTFNKNVQTMKFFFSSYENNRLNFMFS